MKVYGMLRRQGVDEGPRGLGVVGFASLRARPRYSAEVAVPAKKRTARMVMFTVSFPLPPDATARDARDYVRDAVTSYCHGCRPPGSYDDTDPGDPMFDLDPDAVQVKYLRRRKTQ